MRGTYPTVPGSIWLKVSHIRPRLPASGAWTSGSGLVPLHWHFSHPVCFVTGPRITEVSLSGSTWSCIFNFQGPPGSGSRSLSEVGRCRDNRVSYFWAKVYGLVVQVTHPLSPYIVYNSLKKQKNPAWKAKPSLCPQTGCLSTRLL